MSSDYTPSFEAADRPDESANNANESSAVLASTSTDSGETARPVSRPSRSRHPWLWGILTLLLLGGGGFVAWRWVGGHNTPAEAQAPPPLSVKVETIKSGQVQSTSEFVGTLEAQERVLLQPQIQGRIERIFVSSGNRVTQRTPILLLSLDQTAADVSSAVATVNSNRAALATAQAQLAAAAADRVKAASNVRLQQVQFNRTQILVNEGAQARQELDIAQNNLEAATATLNAAEKNINASRASVNQAQSNVQQAQAKVASTRVNLNQKQVVAPIDGIVGDFSVKVGDYVNTGGTLTTIIKNDLLDMRISVPSNNAAQLRLGLSVKLLDASTGKQLTTGSLNFISPQVNTNAQSILVKARFNNANGKLRDGQYVRARIVWNQEPGILIPMQAVNRIGGQSFVFVVKEDTSKKMPQSVVHQKPVQLGDVQNDRYPVLEGVKAGDRLAVSNILKLRDGTAIQPKSLSPQSSQSPQS